MKIYENCIHGAKTIAELKANGITKCDKCHGTVRCPSSNCLFHLDCEPLYGKRNHMRLVSADSALLQRNITTMMLYDTEKEGDNHS